MNSSVLLVFGVLLQISVLISVAQTRQLNWEKEHACSGLGGRECATFWKTCCTNLED